MQEYLAWLYISHNEFSFLQDRWYHSVGKWEPEFIELYLKAALGSLVCTWTVSCVLQGVCPLGGAKLHTLGWVTSGHSDGWCNSVLLITLATLAT